MKTQTFESLRSSHMYDNHHQHIHKKHREVTVAENQGPD